MSENESLSELAKENYDLSRLVMEKDAVIGDLERTNELLKMKVDFFIEILARVFSHGRP